MQIRVRELGQGRVRINELIQPGSLEFADDVRQAGPIAVEGIAELIEATEEIRIAAKMSGRMEAVCDRCLEPLSWPVDAEFRLLYQPASELTAQEDVEIDGKDTEIGYYEGHGLDLNDVVREQILLSFPLQKVCREDCLGLCPVCGKNRNQALCECRTEHVDDRWAALRKLQ